MTGRLYIDGVDIYHEYGVYVMQGGWNELVAIPPLKAVESNDWHEEDGIEADLSAPVLDTREVQVKFASAGIYSRMPAFIDMLSDMAYHEFTCVSISKMYKLRLVNEGVRNIVRDLETVTLKFADDFPLMNYVYAEPQSNITEDDNYSFDGRKFTDYGVRILKGSLANIVKKPSVKANLLRNIKTQTGAIYDDGAVDDGGNTTYVPVSFKSKDVSLTCLATAGSLSELWHNINALIYDLTRPHEHVFLSSKTEELFYCYYKKCSVSEFFPEGKVWYKFTLTLTFLRRVSSADVQGAFGLLPTTDLSEAAVTRNERIAETISENDVPIFIDRNDDDILLATENDKIVFTESDGNAIDLMLQPH